ncbi:hypothetical protein Sjap_000200 [Stephania japonica]|uniref:CBS domain-containing protein n=1 Tax=Stephania japonica TaxID=461633 RepID=A0AAP0KIJ0_9MAGN
MAVSFRFLANEVSDLCIGKPALRSLSVSATIGDALSALKITGEPYLSVWNCNHSTPNPNSSSSSSSSSVKSDFEDEDCCCCVGKVCMVDVVCYLCRDENLEDPASALKSPVSVILSKDPGLVRHVEPNSSLLDAIDLIIDGAQNLVVPIRHSFYSSHFRKKLLNKSPFCSTLHNGLEFCWLTQEDIIRFLLNLIGLFSPFPSFSIESLGLIEPEVSAICYHNGAASAIDAISCALTQQTSVAVVDDEGKLIGEISPSTLACCDETVAAAITTLSAGDLMAYIDCGGPPDDLIRVVKKRLKEKNLDQMCELLLDEFSSCSYSSSLSSSSSFSSDDEFSTSGGSTPLMGTRSGKYSRSSSYLARRAEAIVCDPNSSLVAVMLQALAHRVNYVWVVEKDYSLAGIVTFSDMLKAFQEHLQSML